jgi:hypothetical protein
MEGNLIQTIQENLARIGHIQIADNPRLSGSSFSAVGWTSASLPPARRR